MKLNIWIDSSVCHDQYAMEGPNLTCKSKYLIKEKIKLIIFIEMQCLNDRRIELVCMLNCSSPAVQRKILNELYIHAWSTES